MEQEDCTVRIGFIVKILNRFVIFEKKTKNYKTLRKMFSLCLCWCPPTIHRIVKLIRYNIVYQCVYGLTTVMNLPKV